MSRESYEEGKQEPTIGENMGRPRKPFDDEREAQVLGEAYKLIGLGLGCLGV